MSSSARRSDCPIACTLDLLGDKWTLLVVRDLVLGKQRFDEFLNSPEGIASNILSNRLKMLTELGYLTREQDPSDRRQAIYTLTEQGQALRKIVASVARWGEQHFPNTTRDPDEVMARKRKG
ncbi:winged helix-turn-helix transcriptional regulator [Aeoliella mucimassa]|uniref:Putative HTH-type transcriptional regulator YybR n=1 Tax=Aeoliella mucimassa TaxID=2527972 RepID=A0A518AW61_9BACT|nr:helix-turn-helix domain-containing protein [Aeoliella mucimassa]QDU58962.1 putative HTH-type transcriptional regulator YybR [Aeoliella mucimassa]